MTRFALVSRPGPPPPPTGDDVTSLAVYISPRPGRRAAGGAHRAGRTRGQPDPDRVPPDRRAAGPVRVLPRLHRPRGRGRGWARRCRGCAGSAPTCASSGSYPRAAAPDARPAHRRHVRRDCTRRPGSRGSGRTDSRASATRGSCRLAAASATCETRGSSTRGDDGAEMSRAVRGAGRRRARRGPARSCWTCMDNVVVLVEDEPPASPDLLGPLRGLRADRARLGLRRGAAGPDHDLPRPDAATSARPRTT